MTNDEENCKKLIEMIKVDEMKAKFVAKELTNLIRKVDDNIERAEYMVYKSNEEYVHILYSTGGQVDVCVTADSLSAITTDVLRACE